jgi:alpha-amylase/alpha-mannosidase (GH57 family)
MTRVAILWHMHQPFYQDLLTGEHVLPWVRLHALKDYWGMVALLREFPEVRVTFNLVPSLLVQLEAFAHEQASDRHLDLGLKPADQLTAQERAFCVHNFFHAQRTRMVEPNPRYRELLDKRGDGTHGSARAQADLFTVDDLRDLQVWHKLAWIDPWYHDHDERIQLLLNKGHHFTEQDKVVLRQVELELLRRVIPEYADAARRGQVELSTSPFYHPILPLLCDTDIYLRTHPHSRMPREPFRHPEDAADQLERAVALHKRLFGSRPQGLWPSEGSVSDAMVSLVGKAGLRWMATDEEILARTLRIPFTRGGDGHLDQPERLYKPYAVTAGGESVACGFRDHSLSDLIGFSYASWSADGAADDFIYRLVTGGRRYVARTGEEATIFVILDGENAWEHYEGQGRPFLRALYSRLATHPEIRTVTMHEACAGAKDPLPSIFPGSWIGGDFYIWIGHDDDHRAWGQLAEARRTLDLAAPMTPPAALEQAREEILIAEGSDWFWWYGDDHSSDHDREFDDLFRRHVRNVYRALNRPIPEDLFVTNITTETPYVAVDPPTGFIEPALDGEVTSYFEWIGAGCVVTTMAAGTMQKVDASRGRIMLIEFGFNLDYLWVRIDADVPMRTFMEPGVQVRITFVSPAGIQVVLTPGGVRLERRQPGAAWQPSPCDGLGAAAGQILEVRIPFTCLELPPGARVGFVVGVDKGGMETEHYPPHTPIEFELPDREFPSQSWTT